MPDREKLIELIGQVQDCGCDVTDVVEMNYVENSTLADYLIANGVTIQRWIPVTERLPEVATRHNTRWDKSTDSIRVLCACVQGDGKKMVKEGYCKVYSDGTTHWKIPGTIHSVTHWMPLPQMPKGE